MSESVGDAAGKPIFTRARVKRKPSPDLRIQDWLYTDAQPPVRS